MHRGTPFKPWLGIAWLVAMAAAAVAAVLIAGGAGSAAAATKVWNGAQALPSGSYVGSSDTSSSQVASSPSGATFLYYLDASSVPALAGFGSTGALGAGQEVPGSGGGDVLGEVQFRPNGDAIASYNNGAAWSFAYRFANGTWGIPVQGPSVDNGGWAIAGNQLLVLQDGGFAKPKASVYTYTINADGSFTSKGSQQIYDGGTNGDIQGAAIAGDPGGSADALIYDDDAGAGLEDISRSTAGTWATTSPRQIPGTATNLQEATAPDGRAIATWRNVTSPSTVTVDYSIRDPEALPVAAAGRSSHRSQRQPGLPGNHCRPRRDARCRLHQDRLYHDGVSLGRAPSKWCRSPPATTPASSRPSRAARSSLTAPPGARAPRVGSHPSWSRLV